MKKIIMAFAFIALSGCTDAPEAQRTLKGMGFTDIETTGYRFIGCSHDGDAWKTGFVATGPTGSRVSGVVCSGAFKGATVRFD